MSKRKIILAIAAVIFAVGLLSATFVPHLGGSGSGGPTTPQSYSDVTTTR